VIVDVTETGHIALDAAAVAFTPRTKAIVPVHFAGEACDLDELQALAGRHGLPLVEDAAHAIGAEYRGRKIGVHGRAAAFSFYATKNMTTGEGGMITTDEDGLAEHMRRLALHGMSRDAWQRYTETGSWYYEVVEPGYKDNMTDIQAAMGIHQLRALDGFIARRREIAARYDAAFADVEQIILPRPRPDRTHTYHLYPIRLAAEGLRINRAQFIEELRRRRIGTSVHFIPLHRHPYYQKKYGYSQNQFPVAERVYSFLLSLPLYPAMSNTDVADVIEAVRAIVDEHCAGRKLELETVEA
jgi:dTDP-4-amino-4,6-dideoxygalactose transaminase